MHTELNRVPLAAEALQARLHVGIIMDGNGRWATGRGQPRLAGHRRGATAVRRTVEAAPLLGIETLTLYAFSSDNWQRPAAETSALMALFEQYLRREAHRCAAEGVRLSVIGRRDRLAGPLSERIRDVEQRTAAGRRLHLRLAIDYSSRDAIWRAVEGAAGLGRDDFARLVRGDAPDVDLLIRTGGEQRLSDFLLWECAYAELYFTPALWPDFGRLDLEAALSAFRSRERRFGRVPATG